VVHAKVRGDCTQAFSAGGDESAEEAAFGEFLEPGVPGFHAASEAFEDSCDLGRDRRLAVAKKTVVRYTSAILEFWQWSHGCNTEASWV
jgi:hypothetical protein